jgi:hypothetical protein
MSLLKTIWKVIVWFLGACLFVFGLIEYAIKWKIASLVIPSWIFLLWVLLFSIILGVVIHFVNKKPGVAEDGGLRKEIEGLKKAIDDNKKVAGKIELEFREKINIQGEIINQIYNSPYEHLKLEKNEEIFFILEELANRQNLAMDCYILESEYRKNFGKDKNQADYNIAINKLEKYGYIRLDMNAEPEEYEITADGLGYYDSIRK